MLTTPKRLIYPTLATTTTTPIYTAVSKTIITKLTIENSTSSDVTVTIYLLGQNVTPSVANALILHKLIPAYSTYDCTEAYGHVLEANDSISVDSSSDTAAYVQASGLVITY